MARKKSNKTEEIRKLEDIDTDDIFESDNISDVFTSTPSQFYMEPPIETIRVKDDYLPSILVKLCICTNNAEARKLIRSGIKIDDVIIKDTDYSTNNKEFIIEYLDDKFKVIKS